jgi:predicted Zn-dependent protease
MNSGNFLSELFGRRNIAGKYTLTLTEKDLYSTGKNWCFGVSASDTANGNHILISTYRLDTQQFFVHVVTHKLGHMFGAASKDRRNTEENLGSHCTNFCVMKQRLTIGYTKAHARRLASRQDKFCYDCQEELSRKHNFRKS